MQDGALLKGQQSLAASAVAGFFASFFSLLFNFVNTRLQKQVCLMTGLISGVMTMRLSMGQYHGSNS